MKERGRSIVFGAFLILIGLWLLARAVGLDVPGIDTGWPIIIILGAVLSLFSALSQRPADPGGIWFGIAGLIVGAFFLHITVGEGTWADMSVLWPVFPLAAGLGWLGAWLAQTSEISDLVAGLVALGVGALGFLYTLGYLDPAIARRLVDWWPLVLILIGLAYIVQYLVQRR